MVNFALLALSCTLWIGWSRLNCLYPLLSCWLVSVCLCLQCTSLQCLASVTLPGIPSIQLRRQARPATVPTTPSERSPTCRSYGCVGIKCVVTCSTKQQHWFYILHGCWHGESFLIWIESVSNWSLPVWMAGYTSAVSERSHGIPGWSESRSSWD